MTFEQLGEQPQHLLFKCVSGSRAYNLHLPESDTDIKGVFVSPKHELYGFGYTAQVSNETNDETYFEVGRFIELLCKNNPNLLELLSSPTQTILYKHPLMDILQPEDFLSKLCLDTFAGYAKTQIKKARGLNKKINRPFEMERKSLLDFCYVIKGRGTLSLSDWLLEHNFLQEDCGLVTVSHFRDTYMLYHNSQLTGTEKLQGIQSGPVANDVSLSAVPKGLDPLAITHFNKDSYSVYCRDYQQYWQWVNKRNEARYQNTLSHGKNYDSKNMMHTFRLLSMAEEIAVHGQVFVFREDRDFLLKIKKGGFEYEELLRQVEEKMQRIESLYPLSGLPDAPDTQKAETRLIQIREKFYAQGTQTD